jgi:hypothetical protein
MPRPYVAWSIVRLEALLQSKGGDQQVLTLLAEELSFRKTNRARRLLARVADRMARFEGSGGRFERTEGDEEYCEDCGRPMVLNRDRSGVFYTCSGHPECTATKRAGETENREDVPLIENPVNCAEGIPEGEDQEEAGPSAADLSEDGEGHQIPLWSASETVEREQPPDDRRRPRVLSSIRPAGTPGLPPPWSRPLDGDKPLCVPSDSDLPKLYAAALSALIDEIKKTGAGQKRYELEKGIRAEGNTDVIVSLLSKINQ